MRSAGRSTASSVLLTRTRSKKRWEAGSPVDVQERDNATAIQIVPYQPNTKIGGIYGVGVPVLIASRIEEFITFGKESRSQEIFLVSRDWRRLWSKLQVAGTSCFAALWWILRFHHDKTIPWNSPTLFGHVEAGHDWLG